MCVPRPYRYFGSAVASLSDVDKFIKIEEVMEKAMLFILTCKLAVATYAQAKQMADQCKLNKLLADPVMVGQLDMQGRPSFTFERLISPHHFAETPALQQAANYEWINEINHLAWGAVGRWRTPCIARPPTLPASVVLPMCLSCDLLAHLLLAEAPRQTVPYPRATAGWRIWIQTTMTAPFATASVFAQSSSSFAGRPRPRL